MTEVKNLLFKTRLLTLTGAGGSGKTRLTEQAELKLTSADRARWLDQFEIEYNNIRGALQRWQKITIH
ncbi:MAG: hypothetical protein GY850_03715 [bacterium]|nr:hypothetical protein [bacterium]